MINNYNYYLVKGNGFYDIALKYYQKSKCLFNLEKHKLLNCVKDHLDIALSCYEIIQLNSKYLHTLKFKLNIEKKLRHKNYHNSLLKIGDYYNIHHFNSNDKYIYYTEAIIFMLDHNINSDHIIHIFEDILKNYCDVLSIKNSIKIYNYLVNFYLLKDKFEIAYQISNRYTYYLLSHYVDFQETDKILYNNLIISFSIKNINYIKRLINYYCILTNFRYSEEYIFIKNIIDCIENNSINDFIKYLSKYELEHNMSVFEIKILLNLFI